MLLVVKKFDYTNNVIRYVNPLLKDSTEITLYVWTDASLGNNADATSQAGYLILIGDHYSHNATVLCNLIAWASKKLRRVTRSTFSSELFGLEDGLDKSIYIKQLLQHFFKKVNLVCVIDCYSIVSNLFNLNPKTVEARLKKDIAYVRETLIKHQAELLHCTGDEQLADCLTKKEKFNMALHEFLASNKLNMSKYSKGVGNFFLQLAD